MVRLRGARARHLRSVLRVRAGQVLRAGRVRGPLGRAEVRSVEGDAVIVEVAWEAKQPEPPQVDLVLALPRPKALSRTLEIAACLGVRRIDLVNAWRVEKSYFQSPRLARERVEADLRAGCAQGGHTWVPSWAVHRRLVSFLDETLPRLREAVGLLAHPGAGAGLELARGTRPIRLAIGPEGGWIPRELESFRDRGFTPIALTRSILKSEVAVAVALAGIELARGMEVPK